MIPIYEQGHGKGIGHGLETFVARFDVICEDHAESGRAQAFAFIFYDFTNSAIHRTLKDQGVFAQLDRLAGTTLSIFYLHTGTKAAVERFNTAFLSRLSVNNITSPPCVVFFKFKQGRIEDLMIVELDSNDLIHSFKELYDVIADYVQNRTSKDSGVLKWVKRGGQFLSVEVFRAALRHILS
jgi:hypothetical protein